MNVRIGYKKADLARLQEINDACYSGVERPPASTLQEMISISDVYLLESGGRIVSGDKGLREEFTDVVGFAIVRPLEGSSYLWSLAVDPVVRGYGGGKLLLDTIEAEARKRNDSAIRLHVQADNPAQKLYFDKGYRVYGVSPNYYGEGKDALMMALKFEEAVRRTRDVISQADGYSG